MTLYKGTQKVCPIVTVEPTGVTSLNVTPTTSAQEITAPQGMAGYNPVNVSAVTSSIDNNITASNIKKDVTILGVTGTYEGSGGGGTGINREVVNGVYKAPTTSFTFSLPNTATDLGIYSLYYAFYKSAGLTSADLSSLTAINGAQALYYAFYSCANLVSVDLSGVTTINKDVIRNAFAYSSVATVDMSGITTINCDSALAYICQNCTNLTELDLSNVETITGNSVLYYACSGCTKLESIDYSKLESITGFQTFGYAFNGCTKLSSVNFNSLTTIGANTSSTNYGHFSSCFKGCGLLTSITFPNLEKLYCTGGTTTSYGTFANNNKVQKMYFPKLDTITYGSGASTTNQKACKNVFYGCSSLTELHFGSANQSAIQSTDGYSTAWGRGAGNVTIYFDL